MKRIAFIVLVLSLLAPAAVLAGWSIETIASVGDQGQYSTIAVDDSDQPHVAWQDATNGRLYYAVNDGSWSISLVASGGVGKWASIAVNPTDGTPAIAYQGYGTDALIADWNGSSWAFTTIESGMTSWYETGSAIDLAYKSTGVPCVAYHFYDTWPLTYLGGVTVACGSGWSKTIVESSQVTVGYLGQSTTIATGSDNYPRIAYRSELRAVNYARQSSGGWMTEWVTLGNISGEFAEIALDSADKPYISYFDPDTLGDDCVSVSGRGASFWTREEVECGGDGFGQYTGLAVGADDEPRVAYRGDGHLRYAVREDADAWTAVTVDQQTTDARWIALALDSQDLAHITYYDGTLANLMYAREVPDPAPISIDPATGPNSGSLTGVSVLGADFTDDCEVSLFEPITQAEIFGTNFIFVSDTEIEVDLDLTDAAPAAWDVRVVSPTGEGSLPGGFTVTCGLPAADFEADVTSGAPPLAVQFTDLSATYSGCPLTGWNWTFGDGGTSTARHPAHEYQAENYYTVTLTATSAGGSHAETKTNYIHVTLGDDDDDTGDDDTGDDDTGDDDTGDDDTGDDDTGDDDTGDDDTGDDDTGNDDTTDDDDNDDNDASGDDDDDSSGGGDDDDDDSGGGCGGC